MNFIVFATHKHFTMLTVVTNLIWIEKMKKVVSRSRKIEEK